MVVGIFGVGAIGGSIALRARANGDRVIGYDVDADTMRRACDLGVLDEVAGREELAPRVDVMVLAAHVRATLDEIERLQGESRLPSLMLDVMSVKASVVRAAHGLKDFVATHPMAGTERSGATAARADLFEGRPWAYIPSGDDALDARARDFIVSMGAQPLALGAQEHDRIVALTSHLPQLFAYRYAALLAEAPGADRLTGPVARELLRIAAMKPTMWREIFAANAESMEPALRRLAAELESAADEISRADTSA